MSFLRALVGRWPYFVIAGVVLALDQATKVMAHAHLRGVAAVEIIPLVDLKSRAIDLC